MRWYTPRIWEVVSSCRRDDQHARHLGSAWVEMSKPTVCMVLPLNRRWDPLIDLEKTCADCRITLPAVSHFDCT